MKTWQLRGQAGYGSALRGIVASRRDDEGSCRRAVGVRDHASILLPLVRRQVEGPQMPPVGTWRGLTAKGPIEDLLMPGRNYAHTLGDAGVEDWQPLEEHLGCVAGLAAEHASAFGSTAWGELAGRWHDLGKYAPKWQAYLRSFAPDPDVGDASVLDGRPGRIDHSSAGAAHILACCTGRLVGVDRNELPAAESALAMVIAGHHSGLPARSGFEADRLVGKQDLLAQARLGAPDDLLGLGLPEAPAFLRREALAGLDKKSMGQALLLRSELWTRMLFSALIDADRLDTERFMDERKHIVRNESRPTGDILAELILRVDLHLRQVAADQGQRKLAC